MPIFLVSMRASESPQRDETPQPQAYRACIAYDVSNDIYSEATFAYTVHVIAFTYRSVNTWTGNFSLSKQVFGIVLDGSDIVLPHHNDIALIDIGRAPWRIVVTLSSSVN